MCLDFRPEFQARAGSGFKHSARYGHSQRVQRGLKDQDQDLGWCTNQTTDFLLHYQIVIRQLYQFWFRLILFMGWVRPCWSSSKFTCSFLRPNVKEQVRLTELKVRQPSWAFLLQRMDYIAAWSLKNKQIGHRWRVK